MLFERIRRGQKPVFLFLAVMFGLGFVALGVGSGAGGINLGDLLNTERRQRVDLRPLRQDPRASEQRARLARAGGGVPGRRPDRRRPSARTCATSRCGRRIQNGLSGGASLLELRARQSQTQLTKAEALAAQYTTPSSASAAQALKLAPALSHSVQDALAQPYNTRSRPSSPGSARTTSRPRPCARSSSPSIRGTPRTSSRWPRTPPPGVSTPPPPRRSRRTSTSSRTSTPRPASSSSRR